MNFNTIPTPTLKALEKLDAAQSFSELDTYLAGGTGLTLYLGHRFSQDLDFFTQKKFHEDSTIQLINQLGNFKLEKRHWETIIAIFERVKFSLFYYQYPLLNKSTKILKRTNVASLEDISAMKIAAITDRSTKRDFIDLYFLLKEFSLKNILGLYEKKYQNLAANKIHILKSLIYFNEAEEDVMPQMILPVKWPQVKKTLQSEVKKLI